MKSVKIWFGVVIVILLVLLIITQTKQSASDKTIKIGFIGALSGNASALGIPPKQAIEIAVQDINDNGGIGGKKLEIVYEDGKCTAKDAVSAINKLINIDNINIIIGGQCSSETLGAAPIAESNHVLLISPMAMSPQITGSGDFIFRTVYSDQLTAEKLATYAVQNLGVKKVAMLFEKTDYSQDYKKAFLNKFIALGGEVVSEEDYSSDVTDLKTEVSKIKASNPDAVVFVPQTEAKEILGLNVLNEFTPKMKVLSSIVLEKQSVLDLSKNLNLNLYYSIPVYDTGSDAAKKLFNEYTAKYGKVDGVPFQMLNSYDTVYLLKYLVENNGTDPIKLKNSLYKVNGWQGASGVFRFDKNGDRISDNIVINGVKDGKIVSITK